MRIALLLLHKLAFVAKASPIKPECLSKLDVLGGNSVKGSIVFDWTEDVIA